MANTVGRLMEASQQAKQEVEDILSGDYSNRDYLSEHVRKYVKARLELEDLPEEDLPVNRACGISVAKTFDIDLDLLNEVDVPAGCTRATAVMTKRILLFMALQDDLNFKFKAEDTPKIRTMGNLIDLVHRGLSSTR